MKTVPLRKVTIVAEALLESRLLGDVLDCGARGFTLTEVRGEGSRGVRASEWEGRNVRIETLVAPDVADRILAHVAEVYFPRFAVVAWVEDVEVVRGDKYA
jgi:nitrogen regulatory protein P-II 2